MEFHQVLIAIVGGFFAGCINTLAGNGSAITLSILTEVLGLPGNMANGTNRVGIVGQCLSSVVAFRKYGQMPVREFRNIVVGVFIGAMVGVGIAVSVDSEMFYNVFRFLMVFMFFVLLVKPSRWLEPDTSGPKLPKPLRYIAYFLLGIYGGFI